jgi:hypothetical protein
VASCGIQPHRVFNLRLDLFKLPKPFGFLDMLKVYHVIADTECLLESKVQETLHDCSIRVILALLERNERVQVGLFAFVRVENTSTPKRGAIMSDDVESRHNSKIRLSATDCAVKI